MASEYGIYFIVFSPNRKLVHEFVGAIITDGWEAHVPVLNPSPDDNIVTAQCEAWGGYLYPDFRLMTLSGGGRTQMFASDPKPWKGGFLRADHIEDVPDENYYAPCLDEALSICRHAEVDFIPPQSTDAIAIFRADSRFAPPYLWAQIVIDRYYDAGLRFYFQCRRIGDGDAVAIFHSAEAPTHYGAEDSRHCVAFEIDEADGYEENHDDHRLLESEAKAEPMTDADTRKVPSDEEYFANLARNVEREAAESEAA
ncbi:MAG: hypothetical protein LLG20_23915 [Acidobacteriales bacterium]|nr:hypothetical protein [Terriglobales bacterium]